MLNLKKFVATDKTIMILASLAADDGRPRKYGHTVNTDDGDLYTDHDVVAARKEFDEIQMKLETIKRICNEIIDCLPKNRDWLDPVLEQEIKDFAGRS